LTRQTAKPETGIVSVYKWSNEL